MIGLFKRPQTNHKDNEKGMQFGCQQPLLLGGALRDSQKTAARETSKQRENAETELRRVLVLTSYTASPMPLKRGREPIWPHFC